MVDQYRGQNANMHACEAALWAFEATGNQTPYLERAKTLADSVSRKLSGLTIPQKGNLYQDDLFSPKVAGLIWEHYDKEWQIDPNEPKY